MSEAEARRAAFARLTLQMPIPDHPVQHRSFSFTSASGQTHTLDLVQPEHPAGLSAGILLTPGFRAPEVALHLKDAGQYTGWSRLLAASGVSAITWTCDDPMADGLEVIRWLGARGPEVGVDPDRLGLWACSGNGPTALSLLIHSPRPLRCAALLYPYLLDQAEGAHAVADAAEAAGFAWLPASCSMADLPRNTALRLIRAGADECPGLNETFDICVGAALRHNLSLHVDNLPQAPHAFDLLDDSPSTRAAIQGTLDWIGQHLAPG